LAGSGVVDTDISNNMRPWKVVTVRREQEADFSNSGPSRELLLIIDVGDGECVVTRISQVADLPWGGS
jgi:hypothetical protein